VIAAVASDRKEALALVALVRRAIPGASPALVCEQHPAGAREVSIDFATGNVKK